MLCTVSTTSEGIVGGYIGGKAWRGGRLLMLLGGLHFH